MMENIISNDSGNIQVCISNVFTIDDLVKDDEVIFAATGITDGDLLTGVSRKKNIARTQTLLIRGKTKTIRYINSVHNLDFKNSELKDIIK